jgi:hypothetical protein
MQDPAIIGITEHIAIGRNYVNVPAKIDTGADRSAIWASKIRVSPDGVLSFALFGPGSPHYTGRVFKRRDFGVAKIKSSNGTTEMRYRTHLTVAIGGRTIRALFYLSDRRTQKFPVLIGRRTLRGKFVVDVRHAAVKPQKPLSAGHNAALRQDPYKFHQQHYKQESQI